MNALAKLSYDSSQSAINTTVELSPSTPSQQSSESNVSTGVESTVRVQSRLKPLKLPVFNGNKVMFEDFWALFESLVDKGTESANVKMARLRQSLTRAALEAIRGLGVSQSEYEEAKELLKTKYGGHRRQLQAYMDQLESMAPLKNSDIRGFERFSDLVRVSVVKLQADGRDGELGEGTLHSVLVKKLTDRQVESYSRWLGENKKVRSVLSLRDWLKEEVRIRVEAAEMVHGVVDSGDSCVKRVEGSRSRGGMKTGDRGGGRLYFSDGVGGRVDDKKPPCALCLGSHGVWTCKKFQGMSVESRWKVAKEKHLCFRCLASDHTGKLCKRSKMCNIDGCKKNHHILLHDMLPRQSDKPNSQGNTGVVAGEGEISQHTHTSVNKEEKTETFSLRTVPVWLKANKRKIKVNAILDDASNETFLNEEVAGALGLSEPFETAKVHVLNNEEETFQSMPVKLTIESVDGQFSTDIQVKTCPKVTGTYKVEDWGKSKENWPHLKECEFAKPAKDGLVDLLIGVDNTELHYSRADVRDSCGGPVARLGPLGWTCIGAPAVHNQAGARTHVIRTHLSDSQFKNVSGSVCCEIDQSIKRFWEIETCGTETCETKIYTEEENAALTHVKESLSYDNNTHRYTFGVP